MNPLEILPELFCCRLIFMNIHSINEGQCKTCSFHHFCTSHPKLVSQHFSITRGQLLCNVNDPLNHFYLVRSGALKIYEFGLDGKERIFHFCLPSEVLGFEFIAHNIYSHHVVAIHNTELCKIPFEHLSKLMIHYPLLTQHLLFIMSQRLSMASYMNIANAEQRLIAFFFEISKRTRKEENKPKLILPMARQDIGNYLGLAAETVSRLLTRLRTARLITVNQKQITLNNIEKLRQIAQGAK